MKIVSYNVNGIRAAIKKGLHESIKKIDADMICFQETKAQDDQVIEALGDMSPYHTYTNSAVKKGYSGTCILSKTEPLSVAYGISIEAHDQEGRVLTLEYDHFYLVNVYVPNSSRELVRLPYRQGWDADFLKYLKGLEGKKPVILCGDLNVAHQEIDLARPKANYNKTAGYTQKEIDGMDNFVTAGFIDSYRVLHPDKVAYSWWSYRAGAKENNVGWRLDYFLLTGTLQKDLKTSEIHPEYSHSDHCPVSIEIF